MKINLKLLKRMLQEQARCLTLDVPPIPFEVKDQESDAMKVSNEDDDTEVRAFVHTQDWRGQARDG